MPESPALLAAVTYGWLALLVASPLLVAAAGRVRAALAGILVAAHLSMAFTLQIGVFPVVSATALLPFCPPFVWDRIESLAAPEIGRFRSMAERLLRSLPVDATRIDPRRSGLQNCSRQSDPRTSRRRHRRAPARLAARVDRHGVGVVDAPRARRGGVRSGRERLGYVRAGAAVDRRARALATATTADGDRTDALHGDPVATDRTPSDARGYPTARWRKHFSLLSADDTDRIDATLAHLCDRAAGFSGAETEAVTVSAVEVDVVGSEEIWVRSRYA